MEKISVIVPVYNVEGYIEKCIESILKQSYKELEIILVDDASTDKSGEICEEMANKDRRIKVIHNKINIGASGSRNIGIENATGDYLGFVDADDFIDEDMYEILINNEKTYNADISACRGRDILTNGSIRDDVKKNDIVTYKNEELMINFLEANEVSSGVCDKLFKIEIIKKVKFEADIRNNEDKLFSYRIFKECKNYVQQNISKYNYRVRKNSISNTANFSQYIDMVEIAKIIKNDMEHTGTQQEIKSAKLNLAFTILVACRKAAKEGVVLQRKKDYMKLVKELRENKIDYTSIKSKKRKIELIILSRFPYLYNLLIKIYSLKKREDKI